MSYNGREEVLRISKVIFKLVLEVIFNILGLVSGLWNRVCINILVMESEVFVKMVVSVLGSWWFKMIFW